MSIASELNNLEGNIEDSYDAVNDMGGIIPAQRNMDNLDQAIRTIPQNTGTTYTAGYGIDIDANNEISIDDTVVAELTDIPGVMIGATSSVPGVGGTVPAPAAGDESKVLSGAGTWVAQTAAQVNSDWNAASGVSQILNKPSLATVATSGLYSDLTGTPSLATVATSGDYGDLLNKPTIPTVNDATLTIQHNGTNVQTFTANQSTNATANIETIWADDIEATTPVPAVETAMIADGAVTSAKIADGTIATGNIANSAVTNAKIADNTIESGKMASGVLEYKAGDTITLNSGDYHYFAGRTRTSGSNKYVWFFVQLDKPIQSGRSVTFSPSGYQEVFGPSGTIISVNNPSSSVMTFTVWVSSQSRSCIQMQMNILDGTSITGNLCCSVHIGGTFTIG